MALAVALVAVAAVAVAVVSRGSGTQQPVAQSATGSASATASSEPSESTPSPTPSGVSPASYQKALTAFDTTLARQFLRLRAARNPTTLRAALASMQATLSTGRGTLDVTDPPPPLQAAHSALLAGLSRLQDDLATAENAAESHDVCAGSSATALISRSGGASAVRAAARRVATPDRDHHYRVGGFIPSKRADTNRRLGNGAVIRRATGGPGQLTVQNGGGDATVSLVRAGTRVPVLTLYVRGASTARVGRIGDGTYQVYFAGGKDWDAGLHVFTRDCSFQKFDDTIKYATTSTQYTEYRLTLTAVLGGNASTSDVAPGDYPGS